MSSRICLNLRAVAAWLAVVFGFLGPGVSASGDVRGPRELLAEARRSYEARQVDRAEALFRDALRLAESGNLAPEQAEALLGPGQIELEADLRTVAKQRFEALRQGKVTITTPDDLNGRGTKVALPDHPLFWAGFIVVGEP